MPKRQPKPFFRKQTQTWYLQIGKQQINLGPDKDDAWTQYYQIMANLGQMQPGPSLTVSRLIDAFLGWCEQNRAPRTYGWYRDFLQPFHYFIGPCLTVAKLKPYHVDQWVGEKYKGQSPSTRHGAIRSVERLCNWGVKQGWIDHSPVARMEKPTPRRREVDITPEQWDQMIDGATDQVFRDVLIMFRETGCRPQEIRILEARQFDGEKFILPLVDSKGETYNRVIYPTPVALEVVQRLVEKRPEEPIFRNSRGQPWSANALRCRFRRLRQKLNIKGLCPYATRHAWATTALKNGVDSTAASILMGHRDPSTLARQYQHLIKDHNYLGEQARKATSNGESPEPEQDQEADAA